MPFRLENSDPESGRSFRHYRTSAMGWLAVWQVLGQLGKWRTDGH